MRFKRDQSRVAVRLEPPKKLVDPEMTVFGGLMVAAADRIVAVDVDDAWSQVAPCLNQAICRTAKVARIERHAEVVVSGVAREPIEFLRKGGVILRCLVPVAIFDTQPNAGARDLVVARRKRRTEASILRPAGA